MATHFFWDPVEDNIVQERDDTGVITAEYATEPYLYGNLLSQNRGGVESQYHFDPQGSTVALTNDNQEITDTYAYSAFGEVTVRTGNTANPFVYVGISGYYAHSRNEYSARHRQISAVLIRWLSADPSESSDANLTSFVYVRNSPTNNIDPSGLITATLLPEPPSVIYKCGGYDLYIGIAPAAKPAVGSSIGIVIKQCFAWNITYCDSELPSVFCAFSLPCTKEYCKAEGKCCFYEAHAIGFKPTGVLENIGDRSHNPGFGSRSHCPKSRGTFQRTSEIRLYWLTDGDLSGITKGFAATNEFNEGRLFPVDCNGYVTTPAMWRKDPPDYWETPPIAKGPITGSAKVTSLIESTIFGFARNWNCCSPNIESEIFYEGEGKKTLPLAPSPQEGFHILSPCAGSAHEPA